MCAGLTARRVAAIVILVAIIVAAETYEFTSRITPTGATMTGTIEGSSTSPSPPNFGIMVMEEAATKLRFALGYRGNGLIVAVIRAITPV